MKKLFTAAAVLVALGAAAGSAHAAGYQVDVLSARGTGMATAVTASIDDASSVFYNPAGLVGGKQLDLEVGDTLIIPSFTFTPANGGTAQSNKAEVIPPPHIYVKYSVTDDLALGIGLFSEYGSVIDWPSDFVGRFLAQSVSLQTFNINPSLGFRIGDRVRVGVGVQVVRSVVELQQAINFVDSEGGVDLAGDAWGAGGNAGIQVDVLPHMLTLGAAYRSGVDLVYSDGKAHFSGVPVEFANTLKDQSGTTEVQLPQTINLGASFKPMAPLSLNLDVDYTGWQSNSSIVLTFTDPQLTMVEPKNWHHTWNYHLGAEYTLSPAVTLRGGILFDPTPSPADTLAPDLPDATRINIALGGSYSCNNFRFDLGYQLVIITSNTSTNPLLAGDYKGLANVLALTVAFGK